MPEIIYKEVRFDMYCDSCLFKDKKDFEDPCNECLDTPYNEHTRKPINYKEQEKTK